MHSNCGSKYSEKATPYCKVVAVKCVCVCCRRCRHNYDRPRHHFRLLVYTINRTGRRMDNMVHLLVEYSVALLTSARLSVYTCIFSAPVRTHGQYY